MYTVLHLLLKSKASHVIPISSVKDRDNHFNCEREKRTERGKWKDATFY